MTSRSQEVEHRTAVRKAAGPRRPIYRQNRASRPWHFRLTTGPIKLAFTLVATVAAGAVFHGNLKPWVQRPPAVHRSAAKPQTAPLSVARLVEGYAGLAQDSAASEAASSKTKGKSSSHVGRAVGKALEARVAANRSPAPAKQPGALHVVGRGVKHVGGFLSSPFRRKKSTASKAQ